MFLATLELSLVSTSLVAITDSLQGFDRVSWVVTAYFLTYSGMVVYVTDWYPTTITDRLAHNTSED